MRAIKLVLCGAFALFTLSALAQLLIALPKLLNAASANSDAGAMGQIAGRIMITIVLGAITVWLWKNAMKRPSRNISNDASLPPIPDPRGKNE